MALSGLDIFKLLPKTNCGDCGVPTCMAFAMKIAQKKAELSSCPHASEEARPSSSATKKLFSTPRESDWRSGLRKERIKSGKTSGGWRATRRTGWARS